MRERSDGSIPLFISDNLDNYPHALLNVYGEKVNPENSGKRKRGRPRKRPILKPPPTLQYGQVVKHRDERGRIKSIERRVVFGTEEGVMEKLEEAGCYTKLSINHVERDNLTSRQTNSRLVREASSFSKAMEALKHHTAFDDMNYNFCREHGSLRIRLDVQIPTRGGGTPKRWIRRTPAMAAGITNHRWTMEEAMSYPIV